MTFRQDLACHFTPILLRLALAATFLWAGLGKIMEQDAKVTEDNAQAYVDMGAISAGEARDAGFDVSSPAGQPGSGGAEADGDRAPEPNGDDAREGEGEPDATPDGNGGGNGDRPGEGEGPDEGEDGGGGDASQPDEDGRTGGGNGGGDSGEATGNGAAEDDGFFRRDGSDGSTGGPAANTGGGGHIDPEKMEDGQLARNAQAYRLVRVQDQDGPAGDGSGGASDGAGGDASGAITLRRVHSLALGIKGAATPDDNGRRLMPEAFGSGSRPVTVAWAVAITEVVAGIFVLLGFLARLAGLAMAGVMVGAIWITQIGTPIISGNATLGFLPDYAWFSSDPTEWVTLLFQFGVLCMALGVFFSGAGFLSLDRLVFGPMGPKKAGGDD